MSPAADSAAPRTAAGPSRAWLRAEVLIVLGLSLGQSAVYSLISLVQALAAGPLGEQTTALNPTLREDPWVDLMFQLLSILFTLMPVALVVLLMTLTAGTVSGALRDLGMDVGRHPRQDGQSRDGRQSGKGGQGRHARDWAWGVALTAGIGIPGLAVYYLGRALGVTVEVVPAALDAYWWTVPVLVLHALKNALLEEVIVVGYLFRRLERLGWSGRRIILVSALLRGAYHTYQGIGPGLANLVMGLVFGEFHRRTRRTMPLVIAHTLIDVAAFVGYALLRDWIIT